MNNGNNILRFMIRGTIIKPRYQKRKVQFDVRSDENFIVYVLFLFYNKSM